MNSKNETKNKKKRNRLKGLKIEKDFEKPDEEVLEFMKRDDVEQDFDMIFNLNRKNKTRWYVPPRFIFYTILYDFQTTLLPQARCLWKCKEYCTIVLNNQPRIRPFQTPRAVQDSP